MTQAREIAELGTILTVDPTTPTVALNSRLVSGMLIANGTITANSTSLDVAIPSGFNRYIIRMDNVHPVANGSGFVARISNDNGSTYKSASSDYIWTMVKNNIVGNSTAFASDNTVGGTTFISLGFETSALVNVAGLAGSYTCEVYPGSATTRPIINFNSLQTTTSSYTMTTGWGMYQAANTTITNVRFLYTGTNIATGRWSIHGVY